MRPEMQEPDAWGLRWKYPGADDDDWQWPTTLYASSAEALKTVNPTRQKIYRVEAIEVYFGK